MASGAGFHDAPLIVIAGLRTAALVAGMDLHASDPLAEPTQRALYRVLDLSGQFVTAPDVVVRVDLDVHLSLHLK